MSSGDNSEATLAQRAGKVEGLSCITKPWNNTGCNSCSCAGKVRKRSCLMDKKPGEDYLDGCPPKKQVKIHMRHDSIAGRRGQSECSNPKGDYLQHDLNTQCCK